MAPLFPLFSLLPLLLFCISPTRAAQLSNFSIANSPWRPTDNLTLFSPNQTFAAGFRPRKSSPGLFFFAVWVQSSTDKTVVWSLKGDAGSNSILTISSEGILSLNDSSGNNIWENATGSSNSTALVLGEDGNLVFHGWSSFEYASLHPDNTNTILANQSFATGVVTLSSGEYQLVNRSELVFNGTVYWQASAALINMTGQGQLTTEGSPFVMADVGQTVLRRLTLNPDGNLRVYSLTAAGDWRVVWQAVQELCTILGTCGLNAICVPVDSDGTRCECPPGYQNSSSNSCQLKRQYLPTSKFLRLDFVNFVGGPISSDLPPQNLADCSAKCSANSSCIGYEYSFTGQRSCQHYYDQFMYGHWSPGIQEATYIRVASSETDVSNFTGMTSLIDTVCPVQISLPQPPKESKTTLRNLSVIISLFALELLVGVSSFWAFLRKYSKYRDMARTFGLEYLPAGGPKRFSYAELKTATRDFSNVVGHGGYGMVYKGELADGRIIAVKRLKNIGGGEAEFWAEVTIIARMHHLNLVRLWGFCAEKEQRMLIYEFVPNGSLDKFLFPAATATEEEASDEAQDPENKLYVPRKPLLDWNIRYRIALGVARAIAYLHEECLEWVLHCDIKPENILLDNDFCPKVSDFGLSKLTNKKEKVTMSRLRGTRGYMAPEWVIKSEPITAKADVYSFGMVLLEIVSGVRNFQFQRSSLDSVDWYMPKWAFEKVYVEMKIEDILDPRIMDSYDNRAHFALVERMVKTAMWCLQDRAEMRPSMGKVAKMLEGTVEITEPEKPKIFLDNE